MASIVDIQPTNPIESGLGVASSMEGLYSRLKQLKMQKDAQNMQKAYTEAKMGIMPQQMKMQQEGLDLRQKLLDQSIHRFSNPAYLYARTLSALPQAARAKFLQENPEYSAGILSQYGQKALDAILNNPGTMALGAQNQQQKNNKASEDIALGAKADYDKATRTKEAINRSIYGKNAMSTLSALESLAPDISQYTGLKGHGDVLADKAMAALRLAPSKSFKRYNTYVNTLVPRLAMQLRQFYGGSVQPSASKNLREELLPKVGETPEMFLNRFKTNINLIRAEAAQQEQPYQQVFSKKPLTVQVAGLGSQPSNNGSDPFLAELKKRGLQK